MSMAGVDGVKEPANLVRQHWGQRLCGLFSWFGSVTLLFLGSTLRHWQLALRKHSVL